MLFRIIAGAVGLITLTGTVLLLLNLLTMEYDRKVLLAGYMGIGGILIGVYLLFYAITGQWQANKSATKKD